MFHANDRGDISSDGSIAFGAFDLLWGDDVFRLVDLFNGWRVYRGGVLDPCGWADGSRVGLTSPDSVCGFDSSCNATAIGFTVADCVALLAPDRVGAFLCWFVAVVAIRESCLASIGYIGNDSGLFLWWNAWLPVVVGCQILRAV